MSNRRFTTTGTILTPIFPQPAGAVMFSPQRLLATLGENAKWTRVAFQLARIARTVLRGAYDDELTPPSMFTIVRAKRLLDLLKDDGDPAPDKVVADPDGAIVFTRDGNGEKECFYLWEDGTTEYCRFVGTSLVERRDFTKTPVHCSEDIMCQTEPMSFPMMNSSTVEFHNQRIGTKLQLVP
jgi:hypothetical protein